MSPRKKARKMIQTTSDISRKGHTISRKWFQDIDSLIQENIDTLTCNDVREIYFSLFGELKRWRSSSAGFTGFSEFLIFRSLLHSIGEEFVECETGNIESKPIKFKSKNYELGQNVRIFFNGKNKFPDVYIMKNGELSSIIQIKIVMGAGKAQINGEVASFKQMKTAYPDLQGLFISYLKNSFTVEKRCRLQSVGYRTLVLQDNSDSIKEILHTVV